MADLYANYAALAAVEVEGVAYSRTAVTPAGATWAAIAIHGGGIEGGSGEMARQVSRTGTTMAYYEFAGLKASGNVDLHITSTVFDEPMGRALVASVRRCLSFHGYVGTDGVPETAIGGLDAELVARVTAALTRAGFAVTTAPSEIAGTDPLNICNRTSSGAGVQLEMSRALRDSFFPGANTRAIRDSGARTEAFYRYASAVRAAYLGRGLMGLGSVNVSRWATLPAPSADIDVTASVATDQLATGGSHFPALAARVADVNNCYMARLEFSTTQTVILTLRKRVAGTETLLVQYTTGLTHAVGRRFRVRIQLVGTTLRANVWQDGTAEPPGWQLETTDTSLTAAGSVGMRGILSTTNTNALPVMTSWGDFTTLGTSQTFTVTRSVNGIVKPQSAGADVRLATPTIAAL
ncbi:poly-gamma-glutamate hydrolase family protein [Streptomyces laculatispora]|uniref:poly-gamma-glutamate hydrolase family protein n=1 Tax=Streptomyces laculatispora TaxID=887464 RepID=UPI001A9540D2|nr:poly-gamma-glutamate hydrolase family protein [Streptomyces laculatispora]MBO0917543.1 poly-gamma-glutamate hydrolase family protein [Streptomyces laculatispora]